MATHWQQAPNRKISRLAAPILFAWLSLLISLAYIRNHGWHDVQWERGADWYYGYADNLATEGMYQDCTPQPDSYRCAAPLPFRAYRLPGYPLLIAGIILIAPDQTPEMLRAIQAILMAGITFLTVSLSSRIQPNRGAVIFTGVLMLGARWLYYFVPIAFTEILFTFVLLIFVWAVVVGRWRLSGFLWGVSLLIRTSFLFATPLLFWLIPRQKRGMVAIIMLAVLIPYTVRNFAVLGVIAPFGTNGGVNIQMGHNAVVYRTGKHVDATGDVLPDDADFLRLSEVAQDKAYRESGVKYALDHWRELPIATMRKLWVTMGIEGGLVVLVWCMVGVLAWRKK
jgi:hypothetical protein